VATMYTLSRIAFGVIVGGSRYVNLSQAGWKYTPWL